jgi:transposase InsO family protein
MELWQMDIVGGFPLVGTSAKALTGIDDHSRKCVCARSRERTRAVCDGLRAALAVYGAPQQILTDNGKCSPAGSTIRPWRCAEFLSDRHRPPFSGLADLLCDVA